MHVLGCCTAAGNIERSMSFLTNNFVVRLCCRIWAQVSFIDTTKSSDLSAVQVGKGSTYKAEDTSFVGFEGEVRGFGRMSFMPFDLTAD